MPGSFDLSPTPVALTDSAIPWIVCLFDGGGYARLPNVWCNSISETNGPEPAVATFKYITSDLAQLNLGWPSQYEQLFPIDAQGSYVVQVDDELVVLAVLPDNSQIVLFDGFAEIPEIALAGNLQDVVFSAHSVAIRLWDQPIRSRIQRDADHYLDTTGTYDRETFLPTRFNPSDQTIGNEGGYLPNCVASAAYTVDAVLGQYPVFVDPILAEDDQTSTSYWYVSDACTYLIAEMINVFGWDKYVNFPTLDSLQSLLQSQAPPAGVEVINRLNAVATDIKIRDYDASNKCYPDVLAELLGYAGFVMHFRTDTDRGGDPRTTLVISRRDNLSAVAPKSLYAAAQSNQSINPTQNNLSHHRLARDSNSIVNEWSVETALKQVEATFYLVPIFVPLAGDVADPSPYFTSNLTNASKDQRDTYRRYGVDELGEGFWNQQTSTYTTGEGCDFSPIFPADNIGNPGFTKRSRPGQRTLISTDLNGQPLKAVLEIQFGVQSSTPGPVPGLGDPTTWFTISHGWRLDDDRLGIIVTINNPEEWSTGNPKIPHIRGISWCNNPTTTITINDAQVTPTFALRLTTVVDSDRRINVTARKRLASPTQFTRARRRRRRSLPIHPDCAELALLQRPTQRR